VTEFDRLPLRPELLANLADLGYHRMTPIQAASLPRILAGVDLAGQGVTGSGKTAAFGLGLLQRLVPERFRVQSLVLCPTRELADQVAREIRRLARSIHNIKVLTLCGGVPLGPQIGSLEHGAHIIVGTPGRVEEHLRKGTLNTDEVSTLVLDEADRMLDMGFEEVLDRILERVPARRQTLLFSATWPEGIRSLVARVSDDPELVQIEAVADEGTIAEAFHEVADPAARLEAVVGLLLAHRPASALVFCNTRADVTEVADALAGRGFAVLALHGDLDQRARDLALLRFANGSASVLVCTDVAARGIDIPDLDLVINHRPARDPDIHTHRIGRTGRAGATGLACTLFEPGERHRVERTGAAGHLRPLPPVTDPNVPGPAMRTLQIDGGRRQKLRPGDVVGALTGEGGLDADRIGRIDVTEQSTFVAVRARSAKQALAQLAKGRIKGRTFRARMLPGGLERAVRD
jgi:ATP-independent RNA helicase DbpA